MRRGHETERYPIGRVQRAWKRGLKVEGRAFTGGISQRLLQKRGHPVVPTKELQAFRTSTRGITCHKINPPATPPPPPELAALMTLDYNVLLARVSNVPDESFLLNCFVSMCRPKGKLQTTICIEKNSVHSLPLFFYLEKFVFN